MTARSQLAILDESDCSFGRAFLFHHRPAWHHLASQRCLHAHLGLLYSGINRCTAQHLAASDMPRVVFKLLWDTIEAGQTIAAYVKTWPKTAAYYWVMAVVMPSRDGYLSIRLKPSSPLFPSSRNCTLNCCRSRKTLKANLSAAPKPCKPRANG